MGVGGHGSRWTRESADMCARRRSLRNAVRRGPSVESMIDAPRHPFRRLRLRLRLRAHSSTADRRSSPEHGSRWTCVPADEVCGTLDVGVHPSSPRSTPHVIRSADSGFASVYGTQRRTHRVRGTRRKWCATVGRPHGRTPTRATGDRSARTFGASQRPHRSIMEIRRFSAQNPF